MLFDTSWLWIFALLVGDAASVSYPEAQLDENPLPFIWRNVSRIEHPELCRPRPPGNRSSPYSMLYIVAYLWKRPIPNHVRTEDLCKYYAYDPNHDDEYEMEVEGHNVTECNLNFVIYRSGFPPCPINIVKAGYVMIYCANDRSVNGLGGYLMKVTKDNDRYKLIKEDYKLLGFNMNPKHFADMVVYEADPNNVLLLSFPMLVHVQFVDGVGKIEKWFFGGGAAQYLKQFGVSAFVYTFAGEDTHIYMELRYNATGYPEFNSIIGAFNQVRRGAVHYDASAQTRSEANANDVPGYIIEVFDLHNRAIMNQKCFYSPTFTVPDFEVADVIPFWMGEGDMRDTLCKEGMKLISPVVEAESRDSIVECRTDIFPISAKGRFRIIGMEPGNATESGLPRLVAYDGIRQTPLYSGDPDDLLTTNCFVEENGSPTALAHFGLRLIDKTHFVVFCNRGYGALQNITQEEQKAGSTVMVFQYEEKPEYANDVVNVLGKEHLQVAIPNTFNRFLDNRGVITIPSTDGKTMHFVQMMPCAYFSVNLDDWKITVKPPNAVMDYVCQKQDLTLDNAVVDFDALKQCVLKTCVVIDNELVVGEVYETRNYITSDITRSQTAFKIGQFGCLDSKFQLVNVSNSLHYIYSFEKKSDPTKICFKPSERSGGFQIIYLGDDMDAFCKSSWEYAGVSGGPHAVGQHGDGDDSVNENCRELFVDSLTGVVVAGALCLFGLFVFLAVLAAASTGRRNYEAHKTPKRRKNVTTTNTVASIASTMTPSLMVDSEMTPAPSKATDSEINLFTNVGKLQKRESATPATESTLSINSYSKLR